MLSVNEYLSTLPFDLYQLHLVQLVGRKQSFTRAAETAGLTQSAITRQIKGIEESLGIALFERTTRSVKLTPAGEFLLAKSNRLVGDVDNCVRRLKEDFGGGPTEISIGISRSICLAHLPGLLHANVRRVPDLKYAVRCDESNSLVSAVEANELDVVVMGRPKRIPNWLQVTHSFTDQFTWIASPKLAEEFGVIPVRAKKRQYKWLQRQSYLAFTSTSSTGGRIKQWLKKAGLTLEPTMELDSFDQVISLVALGLGIATVPQRALASHPRKSILSKLAIRQRFEREVVVMVRKQRKIPEHIARFVNNVLF